MRKADDEGRRLRHGLKHYRSAEGRTWIALTDTGRSAMNNLIATLTRRTGSTKD